MSYKALYRVFRPQKFEDVVGQEHITRTLQNAVVNNKTTHAYLFNGPRGTGKTSAAKIFAKAINCINAPVSEPCNECEVCKGITNGTIDDVLEIDAASNNGVDEIRDIRDKVKFSPSIAKYKVYIIDEVHMLSTGAFNALLKTLEEPPSHIVFILATTEPHKIPLTVISRCQRYDFKKVNTDSMLSRMKEIIDIENVVVEEAALKYIAMVSEGGMRDALSLLDQSISFSKDVVTLESVLSITGAASQEMLCYLAEGINNKDAKNSLNILDELINEGKDPIRLIDQIINFYRDILVYKNTDNSKELMGRTIVDDKFIAITGIINSEDIFKNISILKETVSDIKFGQNAKLAIEIAILKLINKSTTADNEKIKLLDDKIKNLQSQINNIINNGIKIEANSEDITVTRTSPSPVRAKANAFVANERVVFSVLREAKRKNLDTLKANWAKILDELKSQKMSLSALVQTCEPVAASDDKFVLAFQYSIHAQMANDNVELRNYLKTVTQTALGMPLDFVSVPLDQWTSLRESFLKNSKSNDNSDEPVTVNSQEMNNSEEQLISEAIKLFGEEIVEIK
ncbi:MAG: polymerase subunit gamma/tau [Bacillales bacterium]|jgi:DNA polymerase-3 subunit gamma/tau|nr:polymerase subunit gamma/tau [Bacillales bacterium]